MKAISVPLILIVGAFVGILEWLLSPKDLTFRGQILPPPDLRRIERGGSVDYFIRAARGVTRD